MDEPTAEEIRDARNTVMWLRANVWDLNDKQGEDLTVVLSAAESAAADRERADANERDAKRWQMVRERYVMVSASPVSWVPSGTAYCEGELDIVADVLAAQSTPDAGRD